MSTNCLKCVFTSAIHFSAELYFTKLKNGVRCKFHKQGSVTIIGYCAIYVCHIEKKCLFSIMCVLKWYVKLYRLHAELCT